MVMEEIIADLEKTLFQAGLSNKSYNKKVAKLLAETGWCRVFKDGDPYCPMQRSDMLEVARQEGKEIAYKEILDDVAQSLAKLYEKYGVKVGR